MPMTLWFKRAKSFVVQENEGGTKQFLAQPSNTPQANVPFWVADTATFKHSIKDGSIVNLTPPDQMPGYAPAVATVVAKDDVETAEEEEPQKVPQAPFGGQPMTPVQPAMKLGIQGGKKK